MSDWNTPRRTPVTGHAALGYVVGQRLPDGRQPELVRIRYNRHSNTDLEAVVRRQSSGQQVEFSTSDSVRFWTPDGDQLIVDSITAAKAVEPPEPETPK